MTLTVTAYRVVRDGDGERTEPIVGLSDLAGVEISRTNFYGLTEQRLSLTMLPRLATSDLRVSGDELGALRAEVDRLKADLTPDEKPYWDFRLSNILDAIEAASAYGADSFVVIA